MLHYQQLQYVLREKKRVLHANLVGGGYSFLDGFVNQGGVSDVFSGAFCPYSCEHQELLFGYSPEKYVSTDYAYKLCGWKEVYRPANLILGLTAQLAKKNERKGRFNGAYLGIQDLKTEKRVLYNIPLSSNSYMTRENMFASFRQYQDQELSKNVAKCVIEFLKGDYFPVKLKG